MDLSDITLPDDTSEDVEFPQIEAPAPEVQDDGTPALASVFANPKDIERYHQAIANGASEQEALAVGDNGKGAYGDDTTSTNIPMVALPSDTPGLEHNRLVEVSGPGGKVIAKVADKMPATPSLKGRASIDLNPAAAYLVGHNGGVAPVTWKWADDANAHDTVEAKGVPTTDPIALKQRGIPNARFITDTDETPDLSSVQLAGSETPDITQPEEQPLMPEIDDSPVVQHSGEVADILPPAPTQETRVAKRNPDGSVLFTDGTTKHANGALSWPDETGQGVWVKNSPNEPAHRLKITKPTSTPHHQFIDLTDSTTGQTYKALADTNTGEIIKKLDDPGSRANAQAEMMRVRIINSAKTQPGIVAYVNVKNNYDSLAQNAAIPPDQRTPADDAAAIQAFGAIEHPGTGVTDADKKQAEGLVPLWTSLKIKANNFMKNKSNVLDPATVSQMRDAAKRALDGRQQTYNSEVAPILKEAQRAGLSPEDVNGALGQSVAEPPNAVPAQESKQSGANPTRKIVGQLYTDPKSGITKKYVGNGQWESQ